MKKLVEPTLKNRRFNGNNKGTTMTKTIEFFCPIQDHIVLDKEIRFNPDLSSGAKLFLAEIYSFADSQQRFYYHKTALAKMFNVAPITIETWVRDLVNKGFVEIRVDMNDKTCKQLLEPAQKLAVC